MLLTYSISIVSRPQSAWVSTIDGTKASPTTISFIPLGRNKTKQNKSQDHRCLSKLISLTGNSGAPVICVRHHANATIRRCLVITIAFVSPLFAHANPVFICTISQRHAHTPSIITVIVTGGVWVSFLTRSEILNVFNYSRGLLSICVSDPYKRVGISIISRC